MVIQVAGSEPEDSIESEMENVSRRQSLDEQEKAALTESLNWAAGGDDDEEDEEEEDEEEKEKEKDSGTPKEPNWGFW